MGGVTLSTARATLSWNQEHAQETTMEGSAGGCWAWRGWGKKKENSLHRAVVARVRLKVEWSWEDGVGMEHGKCRC